MKSIVLFLFIYLIGFANPQELFYKIQMKENILNIELTYTPKQNVGLDLPQGAILETRETKNGKVIVKYKVKGIRNWNFEEKEVRWIEKDFFQADGRALLATPVLSMDSQVRVHIDWGDKIDIANSYGVSENQQSFSTTILNLQQGIFIGGKELHFEKISVMGSDVFVLFKPLIDNRDQIIEKIRSVIENQRTLYKQNDFPQYLVSILKDRKSGGAMAFLNACSIYLADDVGALEQLNWYFAHEHFHNFHGIRVNTHHTTEDFAWFIEGFTEYYSNLTNLRAGVYGESDFVKVINQTIQEYNQVLKNNSSLERFPYVKGHLLALHLDNLIFKKSKGKHNLDDFMKDVYKTFYLDKKLLSKDTLDRLFLRYYNETSFSDLVDDFMQSDTLILDEDTWFAHNGLIASQYQYLV